MWETEVHNLHAANAISESGEVGKDMQSQCLDKMVSKSQGYTLCL